MWREDWIALSGPLSETEVEARLRTPVCNRQAVLSVGPVRRFLARRFVPQLRRFRKGPVQLKDLVEAICSRSEGCWIEAYAHCSSVHTSLFRPLLAQIPRPATLKPWTRDTPTVASAGGAKRTALPTSTRPTLRPPGRSGIPLLQGYLAASEVPDLLGSRRLLRFAKPTILRYYGHPTNCILFWAWLARFCLDLAGISQTMNPAPCTLNRGP